MSLKNKRVLVTGGAGFIGSHLVRKIINENPEKIVVIDNLFIGKDSNLSDSIEIFPDLTIHHEDVADYEKMREIVEKEQVDIVFNLAVIPLLASLEYPAWTFTHNNSMTVSLCELARQDYFDTLIHFSSSEVYGTSVYAPMDESHPLNGTTPYAASKAASDLLVFSYHRTFGIDMAIVRPFNNYGPKQNELSYAGVIPLTIQRIMQNESPVLYGDGKQTRDYIYVEDTAEAAIKIFNSQKTRGKVLNIASGKEIEIKYLIELITEYMGWTKGIICQSDRPADVRRHIANIYLAEDLIGFKPRIQFEEGLRKTVEWYKKNMANENRTNIHNSESIISKVYSINKDMP